MFGSLPFSWGAAKRARLVFASPYQELDWRTKGSSKEPPLENPSGSRPLGDHAAETGEPRAVGLLRPGLATRGRDLQLSARGPGQLGSAELLLSRQGLSPPVMPFHRFFLGAGFLPQP